MQKVCFGYLMLETENKQCESTNEELITWCQI